MVTSPLKISGQVRGWFFEAVFPVKLINRDSGAIIAQGQAHPLNQDWMVDAFQPFSATLSFAVTTPIPAWLVLSNDNPSGLPENDQSVYIPVILEPKNP